MTTIEILKKARELLSNPASWTQNVGARDISGQAVDVMRESAVCFCLAMALVRITAETCPDGFPEALGFEYWQDAHYWNDAPERTHAEVLQRFDEAIARLEAVG